MPRQLTDRELSVECEDLDISHGPTRLLAAALYWRRRALGQDIPPIDYKKLISDCYQSTRHAQGTTGCIAFAKGAEWYKNEVELCRRNPAPNASQPMVPTSETVVLSVGPAASPAMPELTPRKRALIRFALFQFAHAAHHMATEAAQDLKGERFKPGAVKAFMEDAREAEALRDEFREGL